MYRTGVKANYKSAFTSYAPQSGDQAEASILKIQNAKFERSITAIIVKVKSKTQGTSCCEECVVYKEGECTTVEPVQKEDSISDAYSTVCSRCTYNPLEHDQPSAVSGNKSTTSGDVDCNVSKGLSLLINTSG